MQNYHFRNHNTLTTKIIMIFLWESVCDRKIYFKHNHHSAAHRASTRMVMSSFGGCERNANFCLRTIKWFLTKFQNKLGLKVIKLEIELKFLILRSSEKIKTRYWNRISKMRKKPRKNEHFLKKTFTFQKNLCFFQHFTHVSK